MATRFSYALVPLGFSMWLAHYSFHFLASFDAVTPALQRFAGDLGWSILGEPAWVRACCRPVADWLPRLEILFLDLGLLLSLYSGLSDRPDSIRAGIASPEGAGALGDADRPPVRGRSLDCSPTHADAWDLVSGRIKMRPVVVGVIVGWLVLGIWCRSGTRRRWLDAFCRGSGSAIGSLFSPHPRRSGPAPSTSARWSRMPRPEIP